MEDRLSTVHFKGLTLLSVVIITIISFICFQVMSLHIVYVCVISITVYITVYGAGTGRPPSCLKCRTIEHLRKDCWDQSLRIRDQKRMRDNGRWPCSYTCSQEHEESQSREDLTAHGTEVTDKIRAGSRVRR